MNSEEKLIAMSKYGGGRFDLVQAGGGNTSVKDGDEMIIKASGYLLSELCMGKGYTSVVIGKVLDILEDEDILTSKNKKERDVKSSEKLNKAVLYDGERPSIETYLHAMLYKYTFHVHAIAVNIFTSQKDWVNQIKSLDKEALCVGYKTPGIELALELKKDLERYVKEKKELPKVILLKNHGLIISSDNFEEITVLTERLVTKAESILGVDFSRYREVTRLSEIYNKRFRLDHIAYLSEDKKISELIQDKNKEYASRPFCPDGFVFCGYKTLEVKNNIIESFESYKLRFHEPPKIIMFNNEVYIFANDLKKAKMIEDVLKNNLLISSHLGKKLSFLEEDEIYYLGNWEAEKYRQKM